MSFSSGVKDELARVIPEARHCRIAEIAAMISLNGRIVPGEDGKQVLSVTTEHAGTARNYFTLIKKTYKIGTDIAIQKNTRLNRTHSYTVSVRREQDIENILEGTKLNGTEGSALFLSENRVIAKSCCKRAFIRGAFLSAGSVSDPEKFYHLEIVCPNLKKAEQLQGIIRSFGPDAKIAARKKMQIVYIKESSQISDLLGIMEAPSALMNFENIRIMKDMRNHVNRQVNCETANIGKTVSAAVRQVDDIVYIRDTVGLDELPESLAEMAEVRLKFPDDTLKELGERLEPEVGKSGVNHRLRKISEFAAELRGSQPGV